MWVGAFDPVPSDPSPCGGGGVAALPALRRPRVMHGLTSELLGKASRTFLDLAYPGGNVPSGKRPYYDLGPGEPLEPLLAPPVCQEVREPDGGVRGYAFRLGCSSYPHLKLRVVRCGWEPCVFEVDTHDTMQLPADHPDAPRLAEIQAANRRIKTEIEHAWEGQGLTTFSSLLREDLERG